MQAAYPTVAEISSALAEQGVTVPGTLAAIVAAVIADWERKTGYKPFLGASAATTWLFDAPYLSRDFTLDFEGGFWAITSISNNDVAVDADDYDLLPLNAANDGRGWDRVRFASHPGFGRGTISVVGKRGYAEELPDDVYQALFDEMQRRAILKSQTGGEQVESVKQGGLTVKLASGNESTLEEIECSFKSLAINYTRI